MAKLKQFWTCVHSSLWFLPSLIIAGLIGIALTLIGLDQAHPGQLAERWPRVFASEPDGSKAMLAAIATAMMTVAGVVFSVTIVALAQASTQYSPRVLRNFMRDRGNQVVLGSFLGIFAYCLVVLRNIIRSNAEGFVPALAVFFGFGLALVGIGLLVYFIHHIASSIQASNMIHVITQETLQVIDRRFPRCSESMDAAGCGEEPDDAERSLGAVRWLPVMANDFGYVQRVEKDELFKYACAHRLTIRMEAAVGEFALQGRPLVSVCGIAEVDKSLVRRINLSYGIAAQRTVDQDPGFGIRQLVDIAVKALSPGINDTTTAVNVVDYLSQILGELAQRRLEPRHCFEGNHLRFIAREMTFRDFVSTAFEQIIENAGGNKAVISNLVRALGRTAQVTTIVSRRNALLEQANAVAELAWSIESRGPRYEVRQLVNQLLCDLRRNARP